MIFNNNRNCKTVRTISLLFSLDTCKIPKVGPTHVILGDTRKRAYTIKTEKAIYQYSDPEAFLMIFTGDILWNHFTELVRQDQTKPGLCDIFNFINLTVTYGIRRRVAILEILCS